MYINGVLVGVLATIFVEMALVITVVGICVYLAYRSDNKHTYRKNIKEDK